VVGFSLPREEEFLLLDPGVIEVLSAWFEELRVELPPWLLL
jgi:hypothetical protein